MRLRRALVCTFALFIGALASAGADVPTSTEEFIYNVIASNGRDYSGTFVREASSTIYLIGNTDNFVSGRMTFVYFWPITNNYRLDTDTIDRQFDGSLKLEGEGISRTLSMQRYTFYNLRGEYEMNWKVAKDAEAEKVYQDYQKILDAYQQAQYGYQQAQIKYEQKLNDLAAEITKVRTSGGDTTQLVNELRSLERPSPPAAPTTYVSPPAPVQKAFILNLPDGRYRISFLNPDGTVMQGSEKQVIVFSNRGQEKVGYDVIPGDKWTRPETSGLPGSVLYVNGTTDLFLRPYFEKQYNDLYHEKLVNNDARGNINMNSWIKLQQVPRAQIVLDSGGGPVKVSEQPFGVEQLQGASLGYRIVPWGESQHQPGDKPDLIAYHVPIKSGSTVISVSARDQSGKLLAGGDREIRVISKTALGALPVVILLLPLAIAALVMTMRRRRFQR
ncbi:MAG TPA: hypothetical protein VMW69_09860 [Spirochaetia bacterium]|nr:hypothetical protein [Spirochaetia bacterium]